MFHICILCTVPRYLLLYILCVVLIYHSLYVFNYIIYTTLIILYYSPYISETRLNDETVCGKCPMLIIACDGVWDVYSDQEAADFLMEKYIANDKQPFENAAKILVGLSIYQCLLSVCLIFVVIIYKLVSWFI